MSEHLVSEAPPDLARTVLAAARLDLAAYRSIALGRRYWPAALLIVSLSAVSHAALGVAWATAGGWAPIRSIVPAALSQFVVWLGLSVVAYAVGRVLGSPGSLEGVLRAVGVAILPTVIYVAGVVPPLLFVMGAWWIGTTYVALRAALGLPLGPSIVVTALGVVVGYLLAGLTTVTVLDWLAALGYPGT